MPLLSSIFFISLLIHVFNHVGLEAVTQILWSIYTWFPSQTSTTARRYRTLQRQVLLVRKDMMATSSQDEFAKWARLRREHDKKHAELESVARTYTAHRQSFDSFVSIARWLSMNGLRLLLQFWYRNVPMFWLPVGWAPRYIEWLLAFPKAPIGSISINAWSLCSSIFISIAFSASVSALSPIFLLGSTTRATKPNPKLAQEKR